MTDEEALRMAEAIASDRLLVLCGAGLSMSPPSSLPSAAAVADHCATKYQGDTGSPLPASVTSIESIAKHFRDAKRLENYFLATLVPWVRFKAQTNLGHDAVADLLCCRVFRGGVTTNFDALVEDAAQLLGELDFRAMVEATDIAQSRPHAPFLKIHGCEVRSRDSTIWCADQLADPLVATRMTHFRNWLASQMIGRDLLLVGFWSDWNYITELLAANLAAVTPQHVFLVDPAHPSVLAAKAPDLWSWAHGGGITFHHIQESGSDFLDELRRRWSRIFVSQMLTGSAGTYFALFGTTPPPLANPSAFDLLGSRDLYALRRDLTGVPRTRPVRDRVPNTGDDVAAAICRRLLELGATYSSHVHGLGTRKLRIVSARGRVLSSVKADFAGEPPLTGVDEVICAGARADSAPSHIIRASGPPTIIRSGSTTNWYTDEKLVSDIGGVHVV